MNDAMFNVPKQIVGFDRRTTFREVVKFTAIYIFLFQLICLAVDQTGQHGRLAQLTRVVVAILGLSVFITELIQKIVTVRSASNKLVSIALMAFYSILELAIVLVVSGLSAVLVWGAEA